MLTSFVLGLIGACVIFFVVAWKKNVTSCYLYSFGCIVFLVALYFAETPGNFRITAAGVTVERINKIEADQEQLKKIVTTLIKINTVTAEGLGKFGDTRPQRDKLIEKYREELDSYLPPGWDDQLKNEIDSLYVQ